MGKRCRERGAGAIETVLGMGLVMVLLIVMVQFAMWQYVRASVRVATLDAARAGSVVDASAGDCVAAFNRAAAELIAGPMGSGIGSPQCTKGVEQVTVVVDVHLESTLIVIPGWSFTVTAYAESERIE